MSTNTTISEIFMMISDICDINVKICPIKYWSTPHACLQTEYVCSSFASESNPLGKVCILLYKSLMNVAWPVVLHHIMPYHSITVLMFGIFSDHCKFCHYLITFAHWLGSSYMSTCLPTNIVTAHSYSCYYRHIIAIVDSRSIPWWYYRTPSCLGSLEK